MRINPANNITLLYDYSSGDAIVQIPLAFDAMRNIDKLDALGDWIKFLQDEYDLISEDKFRRIEE